MPHVLARILPPVFKFPPTRFSPFYCARFFHSGWRTNPQTPRASPVSSSSILLPFGEVGLLACLFASIRHLPLISLVKRIRAAFPLFVFDSFKSSSEHTLCAPECRLPTSFRASARICASPPPSCALLVRMPVSYSSRLCSRYHARIFSATFAKSGLQVFPVFHRPPNFFTL